MKNAASWLNSWRSILLACLSFFLLSCQTGPQIEICVIGDHNAGQCSDSRLPENKQSFVRQIEKMVNYVATNAHDYNTLLKRKCQSVVIEICVLSGDGHGECFDDRLPDGVKSYSRSASQMVNYVATSSVDYEYLLEYQDRVCQNASN